VLKKRKNLQGEEKMKSPFSKGAVQTAPNQNLNVASEVNDQQLIQGAETLQVPSAPALVVVNKSLFDSFIKEYDDGSFTFPDVVYRRGAAMTCPFGIAEGFKYDAKGEMDWGYVRIHTGVDRAGGFPVKDDQGHSIKDGVICPFNFEKTSSVYYGPKVSYGFLVQMFSTKYDFEMRIGHMDPSSDFVPKALQLIKSGAGLSRGLVLGSAGNLGESGGTHTHTEFLSIGESTEVFETLLQEKFGSDASEEYSRDEIVHEYRKYENFKNATENTILKDWQSWKKTRAVVWINKYAYRYIDANFNKPRTRYSSTLLFSGL
jgi:hypothetical protein